MYFQFPESPRKSRLWNFRMSKLSLGLFASFSPVKRFADETRARGAAKSLSNYFPPQRSSRSFPWAPSFLSTPFLLTSQERLPCRELIFQACRNAASSLKSFVLFLLVGLLRKKTTRIKFSGKERERREKEERTSDDRFIICAGRGYILVMYRRK